MFVNFICNGVLLFLDLLQYFVFMTKKNLSDAHDKGQDLFSASDNELLTTTEAATLCGVSYQKFLNNFWMINFKYMYPGGPRIYMTAEVQAHIEGKNK